MEILQESDFLAEPVSGLNYINQNLESMKVKMEVLCLEIQKVFVQTLEKYEDKKFIVDKWNRPEGGGGITCVLQDGKTFDKAGVNISVVHGGLNNNMIQYMRARGKLFEEGSTFFAAGISSVIHPKNPYIPTIHFNYRYFCVDSPHTSPMCNGDSLESCSKVSSKDLQLNEDTACWWFGGGTDLTPYYLDAENATHFHQALKNACDHHNKSYYPDFKKTCDEYFFIKHRGECRGIGGIFFDDLCGPDPQAIFEFVEDCAYAVIPSYIPLIDKNIHKPFTEKEKEWQLIRRGRYVEFNLIYDRGTKFGLTTPGSRYESILMSLPLYAKWEYCYEPAPDSPEDKLVKVLKSPKDWI